MSLPEYRHLDGIRRWEVFSLHPRTEEEIEEELLTHFDDVCITYICAQSQLSTKFIERLIVLSTGLLRKDNIEKEFKTVKKLITHKYFKEGEVKGFITNSEGNREKISSSSIGDRVDWTAITTKQKLDDKFIRKYFKYLNKSALVSRNDISEDIKKEAQLLVSSKSTKKSDVDSNIEDDNKEVY